MIKSTMENSVNLKRPLIVDIHGGKNWLKSEELPKVIKSTMENSVNLKVPLIVDIHGGKNWMEAK
ncbi:MAG: hypothetical protein F6K40_12840 [Okeania sp. SIO3I5]|uniref:hypothetical protein n=1 Tax=Okeania sp. SIO3I5 TaxID=2607805 RepID=UPI0013BCBF4C|nr:hypothetical protein [Okeania sp. SIO3I5]NEQ37103.1 hypothetical protein [Okeania sp. SIO3I5]